MDQQMQLLLHKVKQKVMYMVFLAIAIALTRPFTWAIANLAKGQVSAQAKGLIRAIAIAMVLTRHFAWALTWPFPRLAIVI